MSIMVCEQCGKLVDTDFETMEEHLDECSENEYAEIMDK